MTVERLKELQGLLTEFTDEFTDHRHYGRDSAVLLNGAEGHILSATKDIVHQYQMFTEFPEFHEMRHRRERVGG